MTCQFLKSECTKNECALWVNNKENPSCSFKFIALKLHDIYLVTGT
jgi:hypothetical protein